MARPSCELQIKKECVCWEELFKDLNYKNSFLVVNVNSSEKVQHQHNTTLKGWLHNHTTPRIVNDINIEKYVWYFYILYMHRKLSIRREHSILYINTEWKYKMRVRTQQCPCLKITAGCTAAKFPRSVLCSCGTGGELQCPLSQEKILTLLSLMTSLQIRNGSSVSTARFQVSFIFKYLKNVQQDRAVYCT